MRRLDSIEVHVQSEHLAAMASAKTFSCTSAAPGGFANADICLRKSSVICIEGTSVSYSTFPTTADGEASAVTAISSFKRNRRNQPHKKLLLHWMTHYNKNRNHIFSQTNFVSNWTTYVKAETETFSAIFVCCLPADYSLLKFILLVTYLKVKHKREPKNAETMRKDRQRSVQVTVLDSFKTSIPYHRYNIRPWNSLLYSVFTIFTIEQQLLFFRFLYDEVK